MSTIIIGKNSKLYSKIRVRLKLKEIKELSHKEIYQIDELATIVVFSYDSLSFESNRKILDVLLKKKKKLIYISTSAVYCNHYTNGYSYPRIKKEIENFLIQFENVHIIRVGMVEGFFNSSKFYGLIKYTSIELLSNILNDLILGKKYPRIIDAWEKTNRETNNFIRKVIFRLLNFLKLILKSNFHFTRPIDLILKIFSEENYGYTFLSNQFDPFSKYVVLGSGMAALGTLEAINEENEIHNTRLIHAKTSRTNYYESSRQDIPIESIAKGGNSNLWHSVISNFSKQGDINEISKIFFEKLFPNLSKLFSQNSYSFIPLFPLRPLKKIKSNQRKLKGLIDETIIYIEKDKSDKITLHGIRSSYKTNNLFLCTGSISSLKILSDSGLIKASKSTISDHLVGYFGQFSGPLNDKQVIRTCNGHFKKFHEIKLNKRSLLVTLRPANYDFKNLEIATQHRNFFGRSSKSIFISLISKVNKGLILDALFNKFGLEFNFSGKFNIVGHIESKNTVSIKHFPFSKPNIIYNEKKIIFTNEDIIAITSYLNGIGIKSNIKISKEILVSPGLHFLNSNIKEELLNLPNGIRLYSTILFEDESPRHPTFDLFSTSYLSTIVILKNNK